MSASSFRGMAGEGGPASPFYTLTLVWSAVEPARVGEALVFHPSLGEGPFTFGRGVGPGAAQLHRPGPWVMGGSLFEPTGPCLDPSVSRAQLGLRLSGGGLHVSNLGRRRLLLGGREVSGGIVAPGGLVEIAGRMIFVCVERPPPEGPWPPDVPLPSHRFGGPDADGYVGESAPAWELRRRLALVAARAGHVLLHGPSGVGKELAAGAVHRSSPRRGGPFLSRSAATLPEALIDAELFGNVADYPNVGAPARPGLLGAADGGTLFLDEIGELPEALQAHLLRVMDSGEHTRLGEARPRRADVRIVGATLRPLGALKPDLLARFTSRVALPPLAARADDLPLWLADLLSPGAAGDAAGPARRPSAALVRALLGPAAPASYRDLVRVVLASIDESPGVEVFPAALLRVAAAPEPPAAPAPPAPGVLGPGDASLPPAAPDPADAWLPGEAHRRRLDLQRALGFEAAALGEDPRYPGGRQAAARHLRVLLALALVSAEGDRGDAIARVAGPGASARVRRRLEGALDRLLRALPAASTPVGGPVLDALTRQYGRDADALMALIEALPPTARR